MAKMVWKKSEDLIEEYKEDRKTKISRKCREEIEKGFTVEGKRFSYEIDNQQNFSDTMRLFDNNMIDNVGWNTYINGEKTRIRLNKVEFTKVYLEGVKHKTDALSKLNDGIFPLIDLCENKEMIDKVSWDIEVNINNLTLDEQKTINKQMDKLKAKNKELENADTMTMMALVQLTTSMLGGF